jgi:hypothetical protein
MTTINDRIAWFIFRQVTNQIKFSDYVELLPTIPYENRSIEKIYTLRLITQSNT